MEDPGDEVVNAQPETRGVSSNVLLDGRKISNFLLSLCLRYQLRMLLMRFLGIVVSFLVATSPTQAQTFEILHAFRDSDGSWPQGTLVQADDGALYGTTHYGPRINAGNPGAGTVFKVTTNGVLTTLVFFDFGTNGRYPAPAWCAATTGIFWARPTAAHPSHLSYSELLPAVNSPG